MDGGLILDINLEGGGSERVVLKCETDIHAEALRVTDLYFQSNQEVFENLQSGLRQQWEAVLARGVNAVALETHPVYMGPVPAGGVVAGVVGSIELPESGLVLEVGESTSPGAGLGLFIRCSVQFNTDGSVASPLAILDAGTPLCGYAPGTMQPYADTGGKSVAFGVSEDGSGCVWFETELRPLWQVLEMSDVHALAGHDISRSHIGDNNDSIKELKVTPVHGYDGAKYFVPSELPISMDVLSIGCMANDLAYSSGPDTAASYFARSKSANILALVQRLERDPSSNTTLRPSRPISTISKPVSFTNFEPMEIGCEYGDKYWGLTSFQIVDLL
jgi:hypothetical protein